MWPESCPSWCTEGDGHSWGLSMTVSGQCSRSGVFITVMFLPNVRWRWFCHSCWTSLTNNEPFLQSRYMWWLSVPVGHGKQTESHHLLVCLQGLQPPEGLQAHSTRGLAASWALFRGVFLQDVCAAASWSSPLSFVCFYMLNVSAPCVGCEILTSWLGLESPWWVAGHPIEQICSIANQE